MQKRISYKTAISDFWNFENFENFEIFSKNPPKFKNFQKTGIYVLEKTKECMYQVSSNSLHKCGFYSTLNVKNGYFSGHLGVIPCISIFPFYSDFYARNDVLRSFLRSRRKTDPYTCIMTPNDRNRQIDLVTSDDLDLRKGHLGLRTMLRCHRPESCRFIGCLCVYSRHFA